MSVTVADCLKLPALHEAELVAGAAGTNRPVASLSVLEYPDTEALSETLLVGNELLISALVQIKDDVDAQCYLIRHLHSRGEACLILYYVGIYIPHLDDRVIKTANDLDFPLIVMPLGRMDFRYSDVIMEVVELVIMDQKQEKHYVSEMVNRLSQFPPQQYTLSTVLRLLSDRIRCTLLLADCYLIRKGSAAWPTSNQWDYPLLLEKLKNHKIQNGKPIIEVICDKRVTIWDIPVVTKKNRSYHLFILDEHAAQDYESVHQAAEVVEIFLNIWSKDVTYEQTGELVHAILNDNPTEMNRIANSLHIDIKSIHSIWIMHITTEKGDVPHGSQQLDCVRRCKDFMQEHHKVVFADIYGKYLVAFSDDNIFDEAETSLMQEFIGQLKQERLNGIGVVCQDIKDTTEARTAFLLVDECLDKACTIYEKKDVFTLSEVRFAQACGELLDRGESTANAALSCLNALQTLDEYEALKQTLCVFLLDADSNVAKAGAMLFMHRNSVQHRLNKIKSLVHCDLSQMPELFVFYQACALLRLLHK